MSGTSVADRVLGVFAKWPRPGTVKTRLGDSAWGAVVGRAFLLDVLARLGGLPVDRALVYAPPEAEPDFAELVQGSFRLVSQGDGDLGRRMQRFFVQQLEAGATRIVVVGTDSPTLPVEHVERAFAELEHADVVLGPACDGGYYLLGCGARLPPVFDRIAWGQAGVLADTVARLSDPSWRLALLPPWYDVDTPEDWALLRGHVAALRRAGLDLGIPHTEALLQGRT
jgi:rSAM/selenodomain-associated transferase 1